MTDRRACDMSEFVADEQPARAVPKSPGWLVLLLVLAWLAILLFGLTHVVPSVVRLVLPR